MTEGDPPSRKPNKDSGFIEPQKQPEQVEFESDSGNCGATPVSSESGSGLGDSAPKDSIGKTFGLVALVTVLSKVFGLIRDIVILNVFGTNAITDAYYFAYQYTGNILVLFGGLNGPFHSSAVSILTPRKGEKDIGRLVTQLLLLTAIFLSVVAVLVFFLAPYILPLLIPGADLAAILTNFRIMVPLIVIAGLVGLGAGISNTYREFFWPSFAPAVASICIITAALMFPEDGGVCLAIGTLIGAGGQFVVQLPGILRAKPDFGPLFKISPGMRDFLQMLGPAAIGTTIGQLNVYIDAFFVSRLAEGSYAALLSANKLYQLPLGVLLTAMLVPILPRFTEQVAAKRVEDMKKEFHRSIRVVWFLLLPLMAILFAIANPVVQLLFQRGQFDDTSRFMVVLALSYLIPASFFYVARDLLTRAFYAHQDSTTPFKIGIASLFVKAIADWALVGPLGLGGITLSTTITTIFNMTVLSWFLRKKIGPLGTTKLIKPAIVMLASAAVCGLATWYLQGLHASFLNFQGALGNTISLVVSIGVSSLFGLALYVGLGLLMRLEEPSLAFDRLRKTIRK